MSQREKTGLALALVGLWGLIIFAVKPLTASSAGVYLALALVVFGMVMFLARQ